MIQGLSHITLVVSDLDRMAHFLTAVFEAEQVYDSGEDTHSLSRERFFLIGGVWVAIMEGEPLPEKTYNHVAFKIPDSEFDLYADRVRALGAAVREGRPRCAGEGQSLYFHDHDNHLFELHTGTLGERLKSYSRQDPLS